MPRYYFDVTDRLGFHLDEVGDEFDSFNEACELCRGILADIVREALPTGDMQMVACDVRDASGCVVY